MLWLEYKEEHPNGLEYSQFCKRYGDWRRSDPSVDMRLEQEVTTIATRSNTTGFANIEN